MLFVLCSVCFFPRYFPLKGMPGCGKTTVVKSMAKQLLSLGVKVTGFVTDEVLAGTKRIGFDVSSIPSEEKGSRS